jgi:hypothetical protein
MGGGICARFEHEKFLQVDILTSPLYAPYPCDVDSFEEYGSLMFCDLPSKTSSSKTT